MTMEYEQWKEILSAIDKDKYLRGDNVINEIKKKLEEKDRDEYKKWEESGFSVNHKFTDFDETLLYLAVKNDCLVLVNALLGIEGINVNAKNKDCETPLHLAAKKGRKDAIDILMGERRRSFIEK